MDGKTAFIKGYFIPEDGEIVNMLYNPVEISEEFTSRYAKHEPVGFSNCKYQYLGGGENTYSFTLLAKENILAGSGYTKIDVEKYIDKIKDLLLPVRKNGELAACPPAIRFVFGELVIDLVIKSLSVKREMWNRYLKLKRAHLTLTCFEVVEKNKNRKNYFEGYISV